MKKVLIVILAAVATVITGFVAMIFILSQALKGFELSDDDFSDVFGED